MKKTWIIVCSVVVLILLVLWGFNFVTSVQEEIDTNIEDVQGGLDYFKHRFDGDSPAKMTDQEAKEVLQEIYQKLDSIEQINKLLDSLENVKPDPNGDYGLGDSPMEDEAYIINDANSGQCVSELIALVYPVYNYSGYQAGQDRVDNFINVHTGAFVCN